MADLTEVLPNFDLEPWKHLTFSLEKRNVLTAELISLDPTEIVKRCPLPLKEVERMTAAVTCALKADLGFLSMQPPPERQVEVERPLKDTGQPGHPLPQKRAQFVKTLDSAIDHCLGGGFPTGKITEIVGESAVGKTQFVLSLLLSAQLPSPQGLGRQVIYLSTEGSLNTTRLIQILRSHPVYQHVSSAQRPTLDRILTIATHDLEAQEHIVQFQLPETVRRYDVGLIVVDSVAANFRAEFNGSSKRVLAERAVSLVRLGNILRKIASERDVAIIATNQVADRFDDARTTADKLRLSSQAPSSSATSSTQTQQKPQTVTQTQQVQGLDGFSNPTIDGLARSQHQRIGVASAERARKDEIMSLDFQQRFFTGWGDDPSNPFEPQKTPALGLTWANQIDARIVLKMDHTSTHAASDTGNIWSDAKRNRHLAVVFAAWAPPTTIPVQYSLEMHGPVSLLKDGVQVSQNERFEEELDDVELRANGTPGEHAELLDPKWWEDEDEEFP